MSSSGPSNACSCDVCQSACRERPGWLKPGDAERIAEHLHITLQELFDTRLAVDWWEADEHGPDTYVLAPVIVGEQAGEEYPADPRGMCTFYDRATGRCGIHAVKPHECAWYDHTKARAEVATYHAVTRDMWQSPQAQEQIADLLGRPPESKELSGGGLFGSLFDDNDYDWDDNSDDGNDA